MRMGHIVKRGKYPSGKPKWYLLSKKTGRNLGGPYRYRTQAVERERQVQYFKHRSAGIGVELDKITPGRYVYDGDAGSYWIHKGNGGWDVYGPDGKGLNDMPSLSTIRNWITNRERKYIMAGLVGDECSHYGDAHGVLQEKVGPGECKKL